MKTGSKSEFQGATARWRSESMWLVTTSLVILASVALAFAIAYTRKVMIPFVLALFIATIASPLLDFQVLRLRIPRPLAAATTLIVVLFVTVLVCFTLWQAGMKIVSTAGTYQKDVQRMFVRTSQWIGQVYERAKTRLESHDRDEESPAPGPNETNKPAAVILPRPSRSTAAEPEAVELSVTPEALARAGRTAEVNPLLPGTLRDPLQLEVTPEGLRVEPAVPETPQVSTSKPAGQPPNPADLLQFDRLVAQVGDVLLNMGGLVLQLLSNAVFVTIFVIFMLTGRNPHVVRTGVYADIDQKIRRYIGTKLAVSFITGLLVWFSLYKMGLRLAEVFGIMAFLLNFIPSIGSIISTLLPLPIALAQYHDQLWLLSLVILVPGAIQMVMGNVIEPKLMGEGLNLHPVTVLLALSFWGLLWGVVGMFLAAPMTAVIRIILMQFDTLKPVGRLLAGQLERDREGLESDQPSAPAESAPAS